MTPKEAFLASLERCEASDRFAPRFYRRFLSASEEIARMFRFTDFSRQQRMLIKSLELSAKATLGDPEGLREIQARTESHQRLAITAEMYDVWLASAIATARECDPEWDAEIQQAWRTLLGFIVRHMAKSAPRANGASPRPLSAVSGTWRTISDDASPCLVDNVSMTGCSIFGYASLPRGTSIEVTLSATGRPPMLLRGRVAYEHPHGFSVAFDALAPEQIGHVEDLLTSIARE